MKRNAPWLRLATGLALLLCSPVVLAQHVRLERCEPAVIQSGSATEIRLHGGGLEGVSLWTSFPAEVERIEEKAPRFRILTKHVGAGALRVHSEHGVSNLVYLVVADGEKPLLASENKTTAVEAQKIEIPARVGGSSQNLGSHFFRFRGEKGQAVILRAESRGSDFDGVLTLRAGDGRRLAQADDSQVDGFDPRIDFTVPENGDYLLELMDSQYRGGKAYQLFIEGRGKSLGLDSSPVAPEADKSGEQVREMVSRHVIDSRKGLVLVPLVLEERRYVTIMAGARKLRSPAIPRLRVLKVGGEAIMESPSDAFEERELQLWLDAGQYQVEVSDAFGRRGENQRFELSVSFSNPPFALSIPGQKDKRHPLPDNFVAVPGGVFVIPVQCQRKQFSPPIALKLESSLSCGLEQALVAENQGSVGLRVRLPADAMPGSLHDIRVSGVSDLEGKAYGARLETRRVLLERDGAAEIPETVDGVLAVRVVEVPFEVEVEAPGEMKKGSATKIPVRLKWPEGSRRFNTRVRLLGLPGGVHCGEKGLNDKTEAVDLELKVDNPGENELVDLVVEVEMDFHRQPLRVESRPFTVRLKQQQ